MSGINFRAFPAELRAVYTMMTDLSRIINYSILCPLRYLLVSSWSQYLSGEPGVREIVTEEPQLARHILRKEKATIT